MVKRIILIFVGLFFLLLLALILLPILFKDKIEARVKAEVNKNVNAQIEWGDWDLGIIRSFPNLHVTIEDIVVTNNAPFEGIQLANIGKTSLTIDIKSIFGDKIDIRRVGLEDPVIHVKVLEDGTSNYDIALETEPTEVEAAEDTSTFHVGLREYWINNGHIIYDDATLPMFMELIGFDHKGNGDFTQDLFVLNTTTEAEAVNVTYDGTQYLKRAKADIKADIDMDLPNMKFTFRDNEMAINKLVLGFDGWVAMPTDDITMDITWDTKRSDLATILSLIPAEFASDLDGVEMSGKAAFNGFVKGLYNETNMPAFSLVVNVDNGRFKYPDLPNSVENIFVDLKVNSPGGTDMDKMVVDMKRFAMTMAGNPVEARMYLTTPISDPNVDAELRANMDLATVKTVVPMEGDDLRGNLTADVRMKGRMSAVESGRYDEFLAEGKMILLDMAYRTDSLPPVGINSLYFDFSPRFLSLTSFDGTVGSSKIQAKGRLDNYLQWWLKDSTLAGTFDLVADRFDLNELMGPEAASEGESAETPADTSKMELIEVPENINFRMNATVGEVIYENMTLTNLKGGVYVHDSRMEMQKLFFNIFDGAVTMDGAYDTKNKSKPIVDLKYDVKDVDIQQAVASMEMIQKMAPIAKTAFGKFSTDLSMSAQLDQHMEVLMNTIAGVGKLRTNNVRVDGFQPLVDLAKALKINELQSTSIQDILFTYLLKDGKMITEPFDVKLDRINAKVGGSTAFEDQAIDYDMTAKVPSDIFGAGAAQAVSGLLGQANQAIGANFEVPKELDVTVKITGTIDKPVIKPVFAGGGTNVKETIKEEVKEQLNVQVDKAKEEAIARAREERDKLIAEAQKQADQIKADARKEAANLKDQAYKAADAEVAKVTNPLAKAGAKLVADKAKQEADKREQQAVAEADRRADGIVDAARKQGDDVVKRAEASDTHLK